MKSALARLGIRGFKPKVRKAPEGLQALRTPEDTPIPQKPRDEIRRDMSMSLKKLLDFFESDMLQLFEFELRFYRSNDSN